MPKYITDDLEISSDEENYDQENDSEKNSDEDNYSEKILMKNKLYMITPFLREQF